MMHPALPIPTPAQQRWFDCEVGVLIHYDIPVFEPAYSFRDQWGHVPDARIFRPTQLDTDQWLQTAVAAGAKYAILVAKHCSGFCLWPTQAHEYSVANTPWRNGQGDIVGDFFASCQKYGLLPGLYYSSSCNAFCNVGNPGLVRDGDPVAQQRYNDIVMRQLTELWTNYGPLFEIWFDGGALPPEQGGPDVASLLQRLQPESVVFQGPEKLPSLLRWVGNERGLAPYPCWGTTHTLTSEGGEKERRDLAGSPAGDRYAPAETDMPNRDQRRSYAGGWFWREGEDDTLYSLAHLQECYLTSVGRNSNLLFGMVIDDQGLVPAADQQRFAEFGRWVAEFQARALAETAGEGERLVLKLPQAATVDHLVLMEDITLGERARAYRVEAKAAGAWHEVATGSCIGHKHLQPIDPVRCDALRWTCLESADRPHIRRFAALGE
jgi:alpha-L-fucosidase